jgi:type I restriction enzyme M protein
MDILWAGGVNNPMDSIEQISYLLFLRLLSERDDQLAALDRRYARVFSGDWSRYAWGNFVTLTGDALFDAARSAIEKLHELPGLSETGKLLFQRATLKVYDRPTLRAVVQAVHGLDLEAHDGADLKGDMYEYLQSRLSMSGTNGQFRTPRHTIALIDPRPGLRVCDPAVGTAGRTTNGTYKVNQTSIEAIKLLLPPISSQREFAARVAAVRALESQQAASRRRLDDLYHSMLHRAFRGEL